MIKVFLIGIVCFGFMACNGQPSGDTGKALQSDLTKPVGGGCDGCELMYVDMPANINSIDTSVGWYEKGQRLVISGIAYKEDGKTPAPDVVIYYWQTDNKGYYSPSGKLNPAAKRHGHIRGWVKTDGNGKYTLFTIRPSPYPGRTILAHIHTSIKEPDIKNEYYIDEFVFDDDPLLNKQKREALENRGGSGILEISERNGVQFANHDIVLGKHIPNYPAAVR